MSEATIDLEEAAAALRASPDYRVLRRFVPRSQYNVEPWNLGDRTRVKVGAFVDVEGTGLDTEHDDIIELGMVFFTYDAETGVVYDVRKGVSQLEQPTRPIPPDIIELTGITPEMVHGQRIDDELVNALLENVAIVFAHNADYDRRMLERRFPVFAQRPWACTLREVKWRDFGVNGGALGNILMSACGEFVVDAHRAATDCHVGVHILATAQHEDRTALRMILDSARAGVHRVCAFDSPMYVKDTLRARGYRALYQNGRFAYWYKDVRPEESAAEKDWCTAYASPHVRPISAMHRYSTRADR